MRETYDIFYKNFGLRYPEMLMDPKFFRFDHLPRLSLFHDLNWAGDYNVTASKSIYQGYQKKILVENIMEAYQPNGFFLQPKTSSAAAIQGWRRVNAKTWEIHEKPYETNHGQDTLIVENYGYLNFNYKYRPVISSSYWQYINAYATAFKNANDIANVSPRAQFIQIYAPATIQGRMLLDRFASTKPETEQMMRLLGLGGKEAYFQLEIWRWLNPETRKHSLLNLIEPKNYRLINFIITGTTGKMTLINMGIWNAWLKGQPIAENGFTSKQISSIALQNLFLRLLMVLNSVDDKIGEELSSEVSADATEETVTEDVSPVVVKKPVLPDEEESLDTDIVLGRKPRDFGEFEEALAELEKADEADYVSSQAVVKKTDNIAELRRQAKEVLDNETPALKNRENHDNLLSGLQADIDALDKINLQQIRNAIGDTDKVVEESIGIESYLNDLPDQETVIKTVTASLAPEDRLKEKIKADADFSIITAAEYRKLNDVVNRYNSSPDPFGSGKPRSQAKIVLPEEVKITQENSRLADKPGVVDKSMLECSLSSFNNVYLDQIYRKNLIDMIDAVQLAGVAIRSHEVIKESSVLGSYERHRLELKPINGQSSTINFTLPIVDEDGTYKAGGNKYVMRKQRVD